MIKFLEVRAKGNPSIALGDEIGQHRLTYRRRSPDVLHLPDLQSAAQELDRTGDATRYYCATHSAFKVAETVFAEQRTKNYTREQWEAALLKAKQRRRPGEWPVITSNDF